MKSRWSCPVIALAASLGCAVLFSCQSPSRYAGGNHTTADGVAATARAGGPATRPELVSNYDALADEILGTRRKEVAVVRTILKATYADAEAAKGRAIASLKSGDSKAAQTAVEDTATLVAQLATEGDASVARVRKRLIEGGHHFNPLPVGASGEGGAHHGAPEHHSQTADGQTPAHHADGKAPAHHADGKAPAHNAATQPPAHHADGKAPAHNAAAQPPAHHADGKAPLPATDGKVAPPDATAPTDPGTPPVAAPNPVATTPIAPAPGTPGHHAKDPAHHSQDPAHHAQDPAHHAKQGPEGSHHSDADSKLGYEPGCVVVTRSAKKEFLEASHALAQLSTAPSADAIEKEWSKVQTTWAALEGGGKE